MLLENVTLGRIVEIYLDREGYRYRLTSKIEDADSRRLCVTLIASHDKVFKFKPGDSIKLVYRDAEQLWEWDNVKAGIIEYQGTLVHCFEITNKGRSFNRRNAYRVNLGCETLIGYYKVPGSNAKSAEMPTYEHVEDIERMTELLRPELVEGVVRDVSATGVGICTNELLHIDDTVFFEIMSPYGNLKVKAQVIRCTELRAYGNKYRKYYGCAIVQTEKKLIKYIYDIQREQLKKQKEKQDEENLRREQIREMHKKKQEAEE